MKIKYLPVLIVTIVTLAFAACSKESSDNNTSGNIDFSGITATDTVMEVNGVTTLTANASGEGLSYTWTAEYGTFMGSGNSVQWTVCHADKFKINCEVKDQSGNSSSKEIYIRTYEPTR